MSYIAGVEYSDETKEFTLKVYEGYFPQNPNSTDYRNYLARAEKQGKRVFTATASSRMNVQESAADAGYLLATQSDGYWKFVDHTLDVGVMVYRESVAKAGGQKYKAKYEKAQARLLNVQELIQAERKAGTDTQNKGDIHLYRASEGLRKAAGNYIAYLQGYKEESDRISNERITE